jgi:hypothetical protein
MDGNKDDFGIPKIDSSLIKMLKKKDLTWNVEIRNIKSNFGVEGDYLLLFHDQPVFLIELKRTMMDLQKTIKKDFANIFEQKMLAFENNIPFHFMVCRCDCGDGGVEDYDQNWLVNGFRNECGLFYKYKSGMRKLKGRRSRGKAAGQILPNVHCSEVEMPWSVYQQPNIRDYKPFDLIQQHQIISLAIIKKCSEGLDAYNRKRLKSI